MGIFDDIIERQDESGKLAIWGVVTGTVKENWNKDFPGKVKVEFLLGETGKNTTGWIPVATPYGGSGYGMFAFPEVGAEVIVAFIMGDRNCPVVIGTLWNEKNKLPEKTATEKNTVKSFRTKGGCEVVFSDEEKKTKIDITTPGKLQITIDDEKKTILLKDEKGDNSINLDTDKGVLALDAKTKITLSVGGKAMLTLDGQAKKAALEADNVNIEGKQALKLKGQTGGFEGAMVNVKASSSLKVESSAIAEIKGAMVKIN